MVKLQLLIVQTYCGLVLLAAATSLVAGRGLSPKSCWSRSAALSLYCRKKRRAGSGLESMIKRSGAVSIFCNASVGLLALTIASLHYSPARAQSADLVLCDRLAAEPADPDKPADVKGTAVIAQSDVCLLYTSPSP